MVEVVLNMVITLPVVVVVVVAGVSVTAKVADDEFRLRPPPWSPTYTA